ncbi:MAG: sigma 54-interacting transcriptional regulator [Polyangiaceae bacterium]
MQSGAPTREPSSPSIRYTLLVFGEGTCESHALPQRGSVVMGRAADVDIRIDDPSVSRAHARLDIGDDLVIHDLQSANGTRIRDPQGPLEGENTARFVDVEVPPGGKAKVEPGHVIHLGSVVAVIQRTSVAARPRRLWPHGYFEGCVEDACARATRSNTSFALMRVSIDGGSSRNDIEAALADATRSTDVLGVYGPSEYEILVVDADIGRVEEIRRRVESEVASRGAKARTGVATYPRDGRTPEALLGRAAASVRGSTPPPSGAVPLGSGSNGPRHVIVEDPAMQRLYRLAERIADSQINVLVLGETGVGKEVLAETIHRRSPRASHPYLRLNCAALSESLLESELFGHEKGAFTGATASKPGLLESAQGGTVFLDEIGEISPSIQVKLLRVLEERVVTRVGGLKPKSLDVRFVFATNRDLEVEVACRQFREDLYFRINGISLMIPPLRERVCEIEPLTRAFLADLCRRSGRAVPEIAPATLGLLRSYAWPGNIRELRNVIERAMVLCEHGVILPEHLPVEKLCATTVASQRPPRTPLPPPLPAAARVRVSIPPVPDLEAELRDEMLEPPPEEKTQRISRVEIDADLAPPPATVRPSAIERTVAPPLAPPRPAAGQDSEPPRSGTTVPRPGDFTVPRPGDPRDVTRERVQRALEQCAGNQTQAAKLLGISRRTLVTRIEEYGLPRPRKPAE